jgi:hypothetical protein
MITCSGKRVTALHLCRIHQAISHRPEIGIEKRSTGRKRYFGIAKEAERLGVSQVHLWSVLTGRRTSARLMKQLRIKEFRRAS